jgi:hypothetical protein
MPVTCQCCNSSMARIDLCDEQKVSGALSKFVAQAYTRSGRTPCRRVLAEQPLHYFLMTTTSRIRPETVLFPLGTWMFVVSGSWSDQPYISKPLTQRQRIFRLRNELFFEKQSACHSRPTNVITCSYLQEVTYPAKYLGSAARVNLAGVQAPLSLSLA